MSSQTSFFSLQTSKKPINLVRLRTCPSRFQHWWMSNLIIGPCILESIFISIYHIENCFYGKKAFWSWDLMTGFGASNFDWIILVSFFKCRWNFFMQKMKILCWSKKRLMKFQIIPPRHILRQYEMNFDGILIISLIKANLKSPFRRLVAIMWGGKEKLHSIPHQLKIWPNYFKPSSPLFQLDSFISWLFLLIINYNRN